MRIVLLGPPGAGKGTQAQILSKIYNIPHISTGEIFRQNIKNNTLLGIEAKKYIEGGHLVPDHLTVDLVEERLTQDDCSRGFLLDGFPRTLTQANYLEEFLGKLSMELDAVINLDVNESEIIKRISGRRICSLCRENYNILHLPEDNMDRCPNCGGKLTQRADDKPEVTRQRLVVYDEQTRTLIDHYEEKGLIIHINGMNSIEKVTQDIIFDFKRISLE